MIASLTEPYSNAEYPMISDDQFEQYYRDGYVILEDVIKPDRLAHAQEAYEETIEAAMALVEPSATRTRGH